MDNNTNAFWKIDKLCRKGYNILDYGIIISTFLSFFIILVFHNISRVTVFPSLLYIPIILFAYRYPGKGVMFATIISISYFITFWIMIEPVSGLYVDAVVRILIFIITGGVVSYLSKQMYSEKIRYLNLFNNLSDAIFVSETDNDRYTENITDCNVMACDSLGYKKKEFLELSLKDLAVPEDREKVSLAGQYHGFNYPDSFNVMIAKKDGTKVPFELSTHTYETGKKTVHVTVAHNIETRLEVEKKILENRWKLEESQKIARLGYWEIDATTGIQSWSDETFRIFMIPRSSDMTINPDDFKRFIHPDYQEKYLLEYESSVYEKKDFSMKYIIIRGDGEERWVHSRCHHYTTESGEIIRSLGTILDITKDVDAGIKIAEQAKFFETLLETIPLPVYYKDKNGVYIGCNRAFANLLGKKKDFILGKTASEFLDEKSAAEQTKRDDMTLSMSGIQIYESGLSFKNRSPRNMIVSKVAIKDPKNDSAIILGVMQDITDIKMTKENLRKSLEEKNVLLQEVHHRVKNNLAVISGILEIEKSRIKDEDALNFLNEAENRIQSMVIVHESLYHSENVAGMDADEHFRSLFESVLISYSPAAVISLDIDTSGCIIDINSAIPCSLVINEILTNSMKYAFSGMSEGKITIDMQCDGNDYSLVIADDGCGIPKNIVPEESSTLGMKVISNIVRLQLMGTVSFSGDNGTKWVMKWPKKNNK